MFYPSAVTFSTEGTVFSPRLVTFSTEDTVFYPSSGHCSLYTCIHFSVSTNIITIKVRENRRANPEILATQGTQDIRRTQTKQKIICVGRHYSQTNTNHVNKTCALLQTTGGKDERYDKAQNYTRNSANQS